MFTHARSLLLLLCLIGFACTSRDRAPVPASTATGVAPGPVASAAPLVPGPASPAGSVTPPQAVVLDQDEASFSTEDERNTINVFRRAAASTVFVTQKKVVVDFFRGTTAEVPAGSGSGFVWDPAGHVVTNFHVVKGAEALSVTLHDHRTFDAEVVGVEPRKDVAVLKMLDPPSDLSPIQLHPKNKKLVVGQKTVAIGNPFGLDQTLTTGVVSALGREVPGIGDVRIRDMVQTDAAINPGNSGGPLLDSSGSLIGMNTMIYSRSGSSAGIGFAVPASTIQRVVPQIIRTGKADQVGLGVEIDPAQRLERRLRLKGVAILRVIPGTPAAAAGLQGIRQTQRGITLGDIIVGINKQPVTDYDDLYNILDELTAGEEALITVLREGEQVDLRLKLIRLP